MTSTTRPPRTRCSTSPRRSPRRSPPGAPVVALESTIISHGMPYPHNVAMAREVEQIVRDGGAVPATIAVLDGRPTVGLSDDELELLGSDERHPQGQRPRPPARRRHRRPRGDDGGEHDAHRRRSPASGCSSPAASAACTRAPRTRWTSRPTSPSSPAPRSPSSRPA